MKTIHCPPVGRFLLAAILLLAPIFAAFGQEPTFTFTHAPTATSPNRYEFRATLPPLPEMIASSHAPMYGLFVHFGDGNFTKVDVVDNGLPGPNAGTRSFNDWTSTHVFRNAGAHKPTLSLTAKYTPPTPPKRDLIFPPNDVTITAPDPPFKLDGDMLKGRAITMDTNHQVPFQALKSTTFGGFWQRNETVVEGTLAIFYGGLRDAAGNLQPSNPGHAIGGSSMCLRMLNSPLLDQTNPMAHESTKLGTRFAAMAPFYDSVLIFNNLKYSPDLAEGRDFIVFQNIKDLDFGNNRISIFAALLTNQDMVSANDMKKFNFPNLDKLESLKLVNTSPNEGYLLPGGGYVHDFFFYEERPVFIHDPNELLITKLTKTQGAATIPVELEYTSCSHYKSTGDVGSAIVFFDNTQLEPHSIQITKAIQPGQKLTIDSVPHGTILPPNQFYRKQINGLNLKPGECFTMHIEALLLANREELTAVDGKILHGCVYLAGESDPNPADICCANLRFDEKRLVKPVPLGPVGPCGQPGFWNLIKCLCASSPLPCWVIVLLVLALLIWLFFKKKN